MVSDVNTGHTNYFVWTHGETPWLSKVGTSTGQSPNSLEVIVQGQQPNKGPNLGHSVGFSYFEIFFSHHHEFIQPHNGWITNPATRWLHHTVGFFFLTTTTFKDHGLSTDSHPATCRDCGSPHLVGFSFFTTNHTNLNGSTREGLLSDHPHGQNH